MFELIKQIFEESQLKEELQLTREYILENDNPFSDPTIVKPVEIKSGYVRYLYQHSNYQTGSSCTLETFKNVYKLLD